MAWESVGFHSWKIFDLALVSRLQQWWLEKSSLSNGGLARMTFLSESELHEWSFQQWEKGGERTSGHSNVLIATHSWSEMDMAKWFMYFNALVVGGRGGETKLDWILYAHQQERTDMSQRKNAVLLQHFDVRRSVITEGGKVRIMVLRRKNAKA